MVRFSSRPAKLSLAVVVLATLLARAASADEEGSDKAAHYSPLVVKTEVLGPLLTGRWALDLEVMLSSRDALTFMPFYVSEEKSGPTNLFDIESDYNYDTQTIGQGLDLQYRRYFGFTRTDAGARGLYVAPGFEAQHFVARTAQICDPGVYQYNNPGQSCPPGPASLRQEWGYFGPSLDVGVQAVLPVGFVFSGSVGLHYRFVSGTLDENRMPWDWTVLEGPGLRPRIRIEAGWAFF